MSYESKFKDGCELHPHCTTCPFEACYRDLPHVAAATFVNCVRVYRARRRHGGTYAEIGKRTGLSRRQVEYVSKILKEAGYA